MKFFSIFLASISMVCTQSIFFSEYAEGSSNNKYLEIYNPTSDIINLSDYAFPNSTNGSDGQYEYWNSFDEGATIAPGDVFVVCHGSSDETILSECDQFHTYLSNGNDGMCLAQGTQEDFTCIDWIGDWNEDPGSSWDVCGEGDTQDNTLVRIESVVSGSDWSISSDPETCEWIVYSSNTWSYVGSHPHDGDAPILEDCSNGIDDDGDGFIDCNDFDCDDDLACDDGNLGSCVEYGCVGYTPENSCQCNSLCSEYNNCCEDYEEICGDVNPNDEDCSNGIDDDGDGFVDCDDFDCNCDANCEGSSEDCSNGIDDDGDGFIDCDDFDCNGDPNCEGSSEDCSNGIDDDGDGYVDCNDFDCTGDPNCPSEDCGNGIDDDGDGFVDCNDFDCDDDSGCIEDCTNGIDDDLDGLIDCDDFDCNGDPTCYSCDDSMVDLFFSEYAEGSSNNKYLEIYNPGDMVVDLSCYAYPNATNGAEGNYDHWNAFDNDASVSPGDVYVICHGSSDEFIAAECNETHTYLSNGDDGFALVFGSQNGFTTLDWIGDWNEDPGNGWDVCGVSDGTKDHTLVRKTGILNGSEWSISSNEETCEWEVFDQDTWNNLGFHIVDPNANIHPSADAGEDQVISAGEIVTLDGSNSTDSDGSVIAYLWLQVSGPTVSLSSYEDPVVTFTAPSEGTLEFQLQVYDNEGASAIDIVSILISGSGMSIAEIQETIEPGSGNDCYPSPYYGQVVTVTGVVTAISPGSSPNFYFQDLESELFAGVYVYDNTIDPELGDELLLTVEIEEYFGLTELINSVSSVLLSTDNVIESTPISTDDIGGGCSLNAEQYEGMLVHIENVTVISGQNEYGEWTVDDGSGECVIDDYFFDGDIDSYAVGATISSIMGVVNYAYGDYRLLPRNSDDININEYACTADGDVNTDASTDVLDVVQIVGYVLGTVDFNMDQECIADVNSDESVDVLDIVMIVGFILELSAQNNDLEDINETMIDLFINSNHNSLRNK